MIEPASLTALKEEIKQDKLTVFDYMRDLSRLERRDLDNAGYRGKSNAEAVKMILDETTASIERRIQQWEKSNADA